MGLQTEAFNSFVPPTQYKRAAKRVADELMVNANELGDDQNAPLLIQMAQEGNRDAQMVLYRKSRQMIAYVFWKNFIGNKKFAPRRLDRGDDDVYATEAWDAMQKALDSFDVSRYMGEPDVLKKWNYWFNRYLKYLAIRLNREIDRQGFTGIGDVSGLQVHSMPRDDEGEEFDNVSLSDPSHTGDIDLDASLERYMQDLQRDMETSRKKEQLYKILQARMEGHDLDTIAADLGTTKWNVRKLMRELKADMDRYGLFEDQHELRKFLQQKRLDEATGYQNVPDWQPLTDLTINQAMKFRKRDINDYVTHHISPAYLIVETKLPNRKTMYTLYFRLPPSSKERRPKLEYANNVDLIISNHRTPRVKSMSMAKQLLRQHFKSLGQDVKVGIDPASPHAWLHAL